MKAYPMELSGGMRQRVMIAMALLNEPDLLIADEPTTALDVTTQAQVLALLRDLRARTAASIILITHDLGVVADVCDDVLVMYAGRAVEQGEVRDIFRNPQHPYTWGLLASLPRMNLGHDGSARSAARRHRCSRCPRAARSTPAAPRRSTAAASSVQSPRPSSHRPSTSRPAT